MEVRLPQSRHTHTVINLHGRDSDAVEYARDFLESETSDERNLLDTFPGIRWVFPTAVRIPSKRFGVEMSQWFDMWTTENPHEQNDDQMQDLGNSVATIKQVICDEAEIIGLENLILCGISQGAATAMRALLDLDIRLCGFVGFSTWLPGCGLSLANIKRAQCTPVFLAHCRDDETIDVKYGKAMMAQLKDAAMAVTWRSYEDGGHWINEPQGIDDLVEFLTKIGVY
ncbi:hypothetical protein B0A50_03815 [Salinomyces thailandicus]|uniref:Phospholipase/carboxylesterase/thioesterase domain-containing protein n=1 Tax=Salinomyces thailandicus TaxID=706561 RepID=A0A4U0U0M8_9PEZI|nr:hypothetical protein B0A50_03815 [Salinomyces thailandica]